jgi:hypothetical protein
MDWEVHSEAHPSREPKPGQKYIQAAALNAKESSQMPTSTLVPHTRINNSIIDECAAQIGIYGLGIYVATQVLQSKLHTHSQEKTPIVR